MINKIQELVKSHGMEQADIMMYFHDQVVIGIYKDGNLKLGSEPHWKYMTEFHIFNNEKELRGKNFESVCEIKDTPEKLEEKMFVIGNKSVVEDGKSIVTQNGREIILPWEVSFGSVSDNPLRLVVHHLFDEEGCICGYRLCGIEGGNK